LFISINDIYLFIFQDIHLLLAAVAVSKNEAQFNATFSNRIVQRQLFTIAPPCARKARTTRTRYMAAAMLEIHARRGRVRS
jgi:hypothetical protein